MRILVAKICHFATSLSKALKKWKAVCIQITFDKFKVGFFKKYFQKNQARKKPTNFWNKKHPTRIFHGMAIGYIYRLRRYAAWQRLSACVGCRCSHPIKPKVNESVVLIHSHMIFKTQFIFRVFIICCK